MISKKINANDYLRKSSLLLVVLVTIIFANKTMAQSYYGFQSASKHTFLFSIIWQGEPKIGFGYINRLYGGKTFIDLQTEIRFPLNDMFTFKRYDAIAGIYKPLALKRTFTGFGSHLRWNSETSSEQKVQKLSVAATLIPSYVFAAPLNDGLYGTIGLNLTYAPVVFAISKSGEEEAIWNYLPPHKFEGGLHYDMLIDKRTLGISLNALTSYYLNTKNNTILKVEEQWKKEGNLYFGPTYMLFRN
jgi:hypothetical protein